MTKQLNLTLALTQDDINRGRSGFYRSMTCPVALVGDRAFKALGIPAEPEVVYASSVFYVDGGYWIWEHPPEVKKWIQDYDASRASLPFTIEATFEFFPDDEPFPHLA